jgi:2-amino-4-hydroxy-6-hydroxymethyldihydropteridine diphosphokinase
MNGIILLLGTNLGDRILNLSRAVRLLEKGNVKIVRNSSIYETEPFGIRSQPWFLNMVLEIKSPLTPLDLLDTCLGIENQMGRIRKEKWGERLIDIDILYYNNQVIQSERLAVPHPGIPDRKFCLLPLCEHWAEWEHPVLNCNQQELLNKTEDKLHCQKTHLSLYHDLG